MVHLGILVESILRNQKKLFPSCVYLEGEYGQQDICIGVPTIIGKNGLEKIIDYPLDAAEKAKFDASALVVRNMNASLSNLNLI